MSLTFPSPWKKIQPPPLPYPLLPLHASLEQLFEALAHHPHLLQTFPVQKKVVKI